MFIKEKVCVVMCVYNGAAYLPDQLRSITGQTRLPDHMVVVDDCSQDDSVKIVEEFAKRASFPVRVFANTSNLGYVKNFEKAISLAECDIIALSDQDDFWNPEKLETLSRYFSLHPEIDMVFSDADIVDQNLRSYGYSLWDSIGFGPEEQDAFGQENALNVLIRRNVVTGATVAFRSNLRRHVLPIPQVWSHDEWIAIWASVMGKVRLISDKLILYRQHGGNQIGARRKSLDEQLKLLFTARPGFRLGQVERVQVLLDRLAKVERSAKVEQCMSLLKAKLAHLNTRAKLSKVRPLRVVPICRELIRGRYHSYSTGWKNFLRDLLEPF